MVGPGLICSVCHEDATFDEMIDDSELYNEDGTWLCRKCRKEIQELDEALSLDLEDGE